MRAPREQFCRCVCVCSEKRAPPPLHTRQKRVAPVVTNEAINLDGACMFALTHGAAGRNKLMQLVPQRGREVIFTVTKSFSLSGPSHSRAVELWHLGLCTAHSRKIFAKVWRAKCLEFLRAVFLADFVRRVEARGLNLLLGDDWELKYHRHGWNVYVFDCIAYLNNQYTENTQIIREIYLTFYSMSRTLIK